MDHKSYPGQMSYLALVKEMTRRYPSLGHLVSFIEKQREHESSTHYPTACSVLEFHETGVKKISFSSFTSGIDSQGRRLHDYLTSSSVPPLGRLYMLEDLSVPYIELFGSYLGVDAQVFASQIQDGHWADDDISGNAPQLLSGRDHETSFTVRYYETRVLDPPPRDPSPSMVRTRANVSRNIVYQREVTKGDRNHAWYDGPVATILRNASFWCRREANGSWNGTCSINGIFFKAYSLILCASSTFVGPATS